MRLSLRIIFIILVILKANLVYSAANPITDIITNHQIENNSPAYKSIVDKSTEEQNVAKYFKLNDLFANPKPNEIVIIRGKLVQSLNNNDLFVFQDGNTVANINISSDLWTNINEKTYTLNKNIQILAKVIINNRNHSVSLQSIKVFNKISNTDNYILTQSDKGLAEKLIFNDDKKLTTRTISDTKGDTDTNSEEDFDSIEEIQSKKSTNLYGVPNIENKNSKTETKVIKETKALNTPVTPVELPKDKPAEQKESDDSQNKYLESENEATTIKEEKPEPEIRNKVPEEEILNYKGMSSEEKNVVTPEEIQRLEEHDKKPPTEKKKNSLFSFGK